MDLVGVYRDARLAEEVARLRRAIALRAMVTAGMSQREIAQALGVTQPAVSQQLKAADVNRAHPEVLLEAAAPILRQLAEGHGYANLAAFGSVARREARPDSDLDLLVEVPEGTSSFDLLRFQALLEGVLGRAVDLVSYGGLKPGMDDDIRREAVVL
jgi:predicted nucleotidyltransferase